MQSHGILLGDLCGNSIGRERALNTLSTSDRVPISKISNFHSLEVVEQGSETQLQVGKKLNYTELLRQHA